MIVVSDTSPILALAVVGRLNLLEDLYGTVIIPEAVFRELSLAESEDPGVKAIRGSPWIGVRTVEDKSLLEVLLGELDPGEAEAIALAKELGAELLLIDERRGRKVASRFGLKFTGVLGVLAEAKRRRLVPTVKPIIDELINQAGFWLGGEVYARFLREAGE